MESQLSQNNQQHHHQTTRALGLRSQSHIPHLSIEERYTRETVNSRSVHLLKLSLYSTAVQTFTSFIDQNNCCGDSDPDHLLDKQYSTSCAICLLCIKLMPHVYESLKPHPTLQIQGRFKQTECTATVLAHRTVCTFQINCMCSIASSIHTSHTIA